VGGVRIPKVQKNAHKANLFQSTPTILFAHSHTVLFKNSKTLMSGAKLITGFLANVYKESNILNKMKM